LEKTVNSEIRHVEITALEKELAALWRCLLSAPDAPSAYTHTCTLTLIVFTTDAETAPAVATVAELVGAHPHRAIVLYAAPDFDRTLYDATIHINCQAPRAAGPQICCEQITITAHGPDALADLHAVVIPLLVSDLPAFLYWAHGAGLDSHLFAECAEVADRVIVDSARFPTPPAAFRQLVAQSAAIGSDTAFGDLNWTRLDIWRELTAQFFDAPDARAYLPRLNRVEVTYAANPGNNSAPAALYLAWLASRLGWNYGGATRSDGEALGLKFEHDSHEINCLARPLEAQTENTGGLVAVRLEAGSAPSARFEIAWAKERVCLRTRVTLPDRAAVERVIECPPRREVDLLTEQLDRQGHDCTFDEALGMVVRFQGE
jgi:glucose-6-phosphate dehydrogenase assembly protein OpcA